VQHHVGALDVEIRPDRFQECFGILARIDVGGIAGRILALVHFLVIGFLVGLAHRHIADLLESEIRRIGLPDIDRMPEDRVERCRHVEIADTAAGDPGRTRTRAGLVDEHDIGTFSLARFFQHHCQMPCCGHSVHAGADDDIGGGFGKRDIHNCGPLLISLSA
jgi:hypothetical protein